MKKESKKLVKKFIQIVKLVKNRHKVVRKCDKSKTSIKSHKKWQTSEEKWQTSKKWHKLVIN